MIIDDAGYLITNYFMRNHSKHAAGNAVFGLYNTLADNFWSMVQYIIEHRRVRNFRAAFYKSGYFFFHYLWRLGIENIRAVFLRPPDESGFIENADAFPTVVCGYFCFGHIYLFEIDFAHMLNLRYDIFQKRKGRIYRRRRQHYS